jgi:hypothetical protein
MLRMHETAAHQPPAVSRLLLLADGHGTASAAARERADTRVRRYRLARLQLDDAARAARHAHLKASYD